MKFEIKNIFTGDVQFECELDAKHEDDSYGFQLGLAVKIAIKKNANLRCADLRFADLRFVDLSSADLSSTDLRFADLRFADLRYTNLSYTNLSYTNLSFANLSSTDLRFADLRYTNLSSAKYNDWITLERSPLLINGLNWNVIILDEHMKIGCELHSLKDWESYGNKRILEMDGKTALKFWKANKAGLLAIAHGDKRGLK